MRISSTIRLFLAVFAMSLAAHTALGQCTPNRTACNPAVGPFPPLPFCLSPDIVTNGAPTGQVGVDYNLTLQAISGREIPYDNSPLGNALILVDTMWIDSLVGLPAGLDWTISSGNAHDNTTADAELAWNSSFPTGQGPYGCLSITGIPTEENTPADKSIAYFNAGCTILIENAQRPTGYDTLGYYKGEELSNLAGGGVTLPFPYEFNILIRPASSAFVADAGDALDLPCGDSINLAATTNTPGDNVTYSWAESGLGGTKIGRAHV